MRGGLTQGAPESAFLFNLVFIPLKTVLGSVKSPAYMVGRGLGGVERYKEEMQSRRMIS